MTPEKFNRLFDPAKFAAALPTTEEAAAALRRLVDALPTMEEIELAFGKDRCGNSVGHRE